jgi:hypothetical protein
MTGPQTVPPIYTMSVTEERRLVLNPTTNPEVVLPVVSATSTLTRLLNNTEITLSIPVVAYSNSMVQYINGPVDLVKPGTYRLTVNFVDSQENSVWAMITTINAVP